jgi:septum formation protein
MPAIILASGSPSRKRLLESVGIRPVISVSGVDEELDEYQSLSPAELVTALAILKAHTVAQTIENKNGIVIGCDSTFEFEGISLGKPESEENAFERCQMIRGKSGLLHTGHCFIDLAQEIEISNIVSTRVHFTDMSDEEISAYVATGEPLKVAGGFTLDGMSAPFIKAIEGEPSNVIGLSLPLLREVTTSLGYSWFDLLDKEKMGVS